MKKIICALLALTLLPFFSVPAAADPELEISAPAAVLMEESTGEILYEKNGEEQRSPASITKIMTMLLIFEELEKGGIHLEDSVVTSARAQSMGGSQVFLEAGEEQTVETLIKCIVVASGNDASVAMAEYIAGSEPEFVSRMNEKAEELGMTGTHFEDCCGLTGSAGHYTTARDVALMSRELIRRYPQVLEYSSIWMEDITHVTARGTEPFTLANTNKMIRSYEGCVGLKTGSTDAAGYCVSAVAKRDNLTLIGVILGAENHKVRFQEAASLLDYGFGNCRLYVDENQEPLSPIPVEGAMVSEAPVAYEEEFRFLDTKGRDLSRIRKTLELPEQVTAPVRKGENAGRAVFFLEEEELGSTAVIYTETIEKADYKDYLQRVFEMFLGERPERGETG